MLTIDYLDENVNRSQEILHQSSLDSVNEFASGDGGTASLLNVFFSELGSQAMGVVTPTSGVDVLPVGKLTKLRKAAETTVIGRVKDLQNIKSGETSLLSRLADKGSPKANWKQNSGVLRQEMSKGRPIRDASSGDKTGQFLNAERNLLESRGWRFDKSTNFWNPPTK